MKTLRNILAHKNDVRKTKKKNIRKMKTPPNILENENTLRNILAYGKRASKQASKQR